MVLKWVHDISVVYLIISYLRVDNLKLVHMVIRGKMAELMTITALDIFWKYITYYDKGVVLLYTVVEKSLHCLFKSALLLYLKLYKCFKNWY